MIHKPIVIVDSRKLAQSFEQIEFVFRHLFNLNMQDSAIRQKTFENKYTSTNFLFRSFSFWTKSCFPLTFHCYNVVYCIVFMLFRGIGDQFPSNFFYIPIYFC